VLRDKQNESPCCLTGQCVPPVDQDEKLPPEAAHPRLKSRIGAGAAPLGAVFPGGYSRPDGLWLAAPCSQSLTITGAGCRPSRGRGLARWAAFIGGAVVAGGGDHWARPYACLWLSQVIGRALRRKAPASLTRSPRTKSEEGEGGERRDAPPQGLAALRAHSPCTHDLCADFHPVRCGAGSVRMRAHRRRALRARNAGQLVNVHVMKSSRQRIPLIRPGDCAWDKMPNWPS
jgi:hypothetical protein